MNEVVKMLTTINENKSVGEQLSALKAFDHLTIAQLNYLTSPRFVKDKEAALVFHYLGFEKLKNHIPDLLLFLQDMNWPAGDLVSELLIKFGEPVIPHIQTVFQSSSDDIWCSWIIIYIVRKWDKSFTFKLKDDLINVVKSPNYVGSSIESLKVLRDILLKSDFENLYQILLEKLENHEYFKQELLDSFK